MEYYLYLPVNQKKRVYGYDSGCEIYSQQKTYLPEIESNYVSSQNGKSYPAKKKYKNRNNYLVE